MCFVKKETAYEVRISAWSSDLCSSDLIGSTDFTSPGSFGGLVFMSDGGLPAVPGLSNFGIFLPVGFSGSSYLTDTLVFGYDDGGASDDDYEHRQRVVKGKRV